MEAFRDKVASAHTIAITASLVKQLTDIAPENERRKTETMKIVSRLTTDSL